MILQIFDIQNKKVVPGPACHIIPELRDLIDYRPDDYLTALAYVCFTTCPDSSNPYVNLDEDMKEGVILADLKPEFDLDDPIVISAQQKLKELYETPSLRAFMGCKKMLDKMGKYLDTEQITDGKEGNATTIRGIMKEMPDYWETYRKMENILKEEQAKARGGVKVAYDLKQGYKDSKSDDND